MGVPHERRSSSTSSRSRVRARCASIRTTTSAGRSHGDGPFHGAQCSSRNQGSGGGLSGSLKKDKSSFLDQHERIDVVFDAETSWAQLPTGLQSNTLNLRTRNDNVFVNGLLDYAITRDQTLRSFVRAARTRRRIRASARSTCRNGRRRPIRTITRFGYRRRVRSGVEILHQHAVAGYGE